MPMPMCFCVYVYVHIYSRAQLAFTHVVLCFFFSQAFLRCQLYKLYKLMDAI